MNWLPIVLVVVSTVIYQLGQRAIPAGVNAGVATLAAYVIAMAGTLATLPLFSGGASVTASVRMLNYGSLLVGLGALGIEIGFLLAYRAGWQIGTTSLIANAMVAVALLAISAAFFRESITAPRAAGILLCLAGLWLVARPPA
jgi:drug/metabolite transporter (DMT)-like permease